MALFPESNAVYPPKVGTSKIITLTGEIRRVKNEGGEGNYKDKNQKDTGYYDLIPIEDGEEMKLNTWMLYFALRDSGADVGDTIEIDHPVARKWTVTKIDVE